MAAVAGIDDTIFALLEARGRGKSICPSEVARTIDPEGWRRVMRQIRPVAVALARRGRVQITRHGKAVDPNTFKGVWRIRLPEAPRE